MMSNFKTIAYIRTDFKEKFGIPRQSGRSPSLMGTIIFTDEYRNSEALRGIENYSHLWLIFDFSKSHRDGWSPTVRPPRLGGNKRVGVFATRSPFRPNPIGLSSVKLERLEETNDGTVIIVSGVDILDNTPIFDIKPYIPHSDCHPEATGGFSEEFIDHKLDVIIPDEIAVLIPQDKLQAIIECISDDPRPGYQCEPDRIYNMKFSNYDIHFKVLGNVCHIIGVD